MASRNTNSNDRPGTADARNQHEYLKRYDNGGIEDC